MKQLALSSSSLKQPHTTCKPLRLHAGLRTKIIAPIALLLFGCWLISLFVFQLITRDITTRALELQHGPSAQRAFTLLKQRELELLLSTTMLTALPADLISSFFQAPQAATRPQQLQAFSAAFPRGKLALLNQQGQLVVDTGLDRQLADSLVARFSSSPASQARTQLIRQHSGIWLVASAPFQLEAQASPARLYAILDLTTELAHIRDEIGLGAELLILDQPAQTTVLAGVYESLQASLDQFRNSYQGLCFYPQVVQLGNQDLHLVLRHSQADYTAIIGAGALTLLASYAASLALLLGSALLLTYMVTRPLLHLALVANAVASGNHRLRTGYQSHDEIGQVGRAFDQATDRIVCLLESQARLSGQLATILESITDGVIAIDQNERVVLINAAAEQLLGLRATTDLRHTHTTLDSLAVAVGRGAGDALLYDVRQMLAARGTSSEPRRISFGNQIVQMECVPMREAGSGCVVILHNLHDIIAAERAKDQFLATASHELRTPLTGIAGFLDLLTLEGIHNLTETQQVAVTTIRHQTAIMVRLASDLLEMARLDLGSVRCDRHWIELSSIVYDTIAIFTPTIDQRRMRVVVEIEPELPPILIDELHLRRIVTNLFTNALKYSHDQGGIILRAQYITDSLLLPAQSYASTWVHSSDASIVLTIEDAGVGIRMVDQEHIFTRFFRSTNTRSVEAGGVGLGLSITRTLIELHSGQIGFHSIEGQGSCFWIRFAVHPDESLAQRQGSTGMETQAWDCELEVSGS